MMMMSLLSFNTVHSHLTCHAAATHHHETGALTARCRLADPP
jgi:hypothetical protein